MQFPRKSNDTNPAESVTLGQRLVAKFTVDMPPSVNDLYVTRRGGMGKALTTTAKTYQRRIKEVISRNHELLVSSFPFHDQEIKYGLHIRLFLQVENAGWYEKDRNGERKAKTRYKRFDTDNRVKFLKDCVCSSLGIPGDEQFFLDCVSKEEGQTRVEVNIWVRE